MSEVPSNLAQLFTAHALAGLCANPELRNTPAKNLAFLAADIGFETARHFKTPIKQPAQSPAQGTEQRDPDL